MQRQEWTDEQKGRIAVVVFALLVAIQLVIALSRTHIHFWHHAHGPGEIIILALLLTGLAFHKTWVWWVFVLLFAVGDLVYALAVSFNVATVILSLAELAVLLSPPMRRWVRVGRYAGDVPEKEHAEQVW